MPRNHNKDNHIAIEATERQREVLELRKAGLSFQAIADQLGYKDHSGAYRAFRAALKKTIQQPADEVRDLEVERLDAMLAALWPEIHSGGKNLTWHVDRVLKIMERRAALLGLDAPVKREESLHVTFERLATQIAAELDLEPGELVAEAERILAKARS